MRPNKIKQIWRDGRFVTMGWLSVSHGFTAEIMARHTAMPVHPIRDGDTVAINVSIR